MLWQSVVARSSGSSSEPVFHRAAREFEHLAVLPIRKMICQPCPGDPFKLGHFIREGLIEPLAVISAGPDMRGPWRGFADGGELLPARCKLFREGRAPGPVIAGEAANAGGGACS
jgi:hypothetical protein